MLLALMLFVACSAADGAETNRLSRYSVVRLRLVSPGDLRRIAGLGISLEGIRLRETASVDLTLDESEVLKIRNAGFAVETVVADWHASYASRLASDAPASMLTSRARGFHLGSMGGYLTLTEVIAELDSMHARYPQIIGKRDSIGRSFEGRTLWGVRISGNAGAGGNRPCALFTALHHAREPEGMMTLIYFMWYVLEQYGVNQTITALLDSRELYIVPVVNPDGYAYNSATLPAGGGLWRKNRRMNGDGSMGVDLNRNYGFQWGYDDAGSSPTPGDITYRGAGAFSEPETQALRDLCQKKKPACALNYHTYGNDLIHPWGYSDRSTPDSLLYRRLTELMTVQNAFVTGTGGFTLGYTTNGDSDDWMYGDTALKPRIIALTAEVGGVDDGFWPLASRILPLADLNLEANIVLAQCAGQHLGIDVRDVTPIVSGEDMRVDFRLVNLGLGAQSSTATLQFASEWVDVVSPALSVVALGETTAATVLLRRRAGVPDGTRAVVRVVCEYAGGRSTDSLYFRLGTPAVLFVDSADRTNGLWDARSVGSLTTWGFTSRAMFAGAGSYADSPWGQYPKNYTSTYTLRQMLPLFGFAADLRFVARWDIEPEYDFCLVEASPDSGQTWFSLPGRFTRRASGAIGGKQMGDAWGYDRNRTAWVEECIDLAPVLGTRAMLRFRFESDAYVQYDGFYADNLRILLYAPALSSASHPVLPELMVLEQNYPNPFNPGTTIGFGVSGPGSRWVRLSVLDLLGREVAVLVDEAKAAGRYAVSFNTERLASGTYFYRLTAGGFHDVKKMVVLR